MPSRTGQSVFVVRPRLQTAAIVFAGVLAFAPAAGAPPKQAPPSGSTPSPSASPASAMRSKLRAISPADISMLLKQVYSKPARTKKSPALGTVTAAAREEIVHVTAQHASARSLLVGTRETSAVDAKLLQWAKACTAGDPSAPPEIWEVRGRIGAGGNLTISGACFGSSPKVEMLGEFQNGRLPLVIQSATSDSIVAGIPSVVGVYDQDVRIRVLRGTTISNEVQHAFVTAKERHIVSVKPGSCEWGPPSDLIVYDWIECKSSGAAHLVHTASCVPFKQLIVTRYDDYSFGAPRGWRLDSVDLYVYHGEADLSDQDSTYFKVKWRDELVKEDRGGSVLSPWCYDFFASVYTMEVWAVGPKGTFPAS